MLMQWHLALQKQIWSKKMPENILAQMRSIVPLQRLGTPRDIANAYLFLASEEASYVHGHTLHVDGAIMM